MRSSWRAACLPKQHQLLICNIGWQPFEANTPVRRLRGIFKRYQTFDSVTALGRGEHDANVVFMVILARTHSDRVH